MKTKFHRVLSTILVLASLVSCFAVFASASETSYSIGEEASDLSEIDVVINRDFSEGWDYDNGFGAISTHKASIDFEEDVTYRYNYFWRFEATEETSSAYSGLNFSPNIQKENGTVVQFKIKADDACNVGRIMYITTPAGATFNLLYITGRTVYAYENTNARYKVCELTNDWVTLTFIFDWDLKDTEGNTLFHADLYVGTEPTPLTYEAKYTNGTDVGIQNLYFGIGGGGPEKVGMGFCIDDLEIYHNTKVAYSNIDSLGTAGSKIDNNAEIAIDIQEGPGAKNTEEIISEALCMKVGVESALIRNTKASIAEYCTPVIVDGRVMVPLELLLDFIGYPYYLHTDNLSYDITTGVSATYITIGRDSATVDGNRVELSVAPGYLKNSLDEQTPVIAAEDIPNIFPGWQLVYDDMGLIIIYEGEASENGEALINREDDLELMLTIMKRFIFDTVTADEEGNAFEEIADSYVATGEKVIADAKANTNLAHPYIYANQNTFDSLNNMYTATENVDAKAQNYLASLVSKADAIYAEFAKINSETGVYEGILEAKRPINGYGDGESPDPTNPNDTTLPDTADGYNPSGTLDEIEVYTAKLVELAFAYQVTREDKYALLAYDISVVLASWVHWGPGYIINCATATGNFAVAYDWLYNFYLEEFGQQAVDSLAEALYNKGVKQGYNASMGLACEHPRTIGNECDYINLSTNWNAACSSGMIIGALALIDYEEYGATGSYLIGNNIHNLIANGLDPYAPDGSYAESALLWADATNAFVKLIMALESSTGYTYGFNNTWGIDKTFYFACYIEDSDGKVWNYHEGGADEFITGELMGIDTQMFNYAGKFLNDNVLITIRQNQLEKGKAATIFDMLFYPTEAGESDVELELDYHMEGIHAFISRSDWEEGALYTGIMGGANDVYGGQIDSGNFIYRNEGITWFADLGSDNDELNGYLGSYRNYYYRNNAEGQNVVFMTSVQSAIPFGQDKSGKGTIMSTYVNEYGSYAVLDNTSCYSTYSIFARRGMLVTNNRKTVVIQDEMSFKKIQQVTWVAHTAADISIYDDDGNISNIGKTAFLTMKDESGAEKILRVSLVSKVDLYFEVADAKAGLLSETYTAKKAGEAEYSRDGFSRLVIKSGEIVMFNAAVVMEMVDSVGDMESVGYKWTDMSAWVPTESAASDDEAVLVRGTPVKSDIKNEAGRLQMFRDILNTAYGENLSDYYKSLTLIAYTLKTFTEDTLDGVYTESYSQYLDYYYEYEDYVMNINSGVEANTNFARKSSGIKISEK